MTSLRATLDRAFLDSAGWSRAARVRIAGDASFRHYDRLESADGPAVLMDAAPPREDVRPFVAITRYLESLGLSAPGLIAADVAHGFLLLEDLGDDRYSRVIPREPAMERGLYEAAVDVLVDLHRHPVPGDLAVGNGETYVLPRYDDALYGRELQLFTDWYLPALTGTPMTVALRQEFIALWRAALAQLEPGRDVLVLRDYHADNLMWLPDRDGVARVGLLDFQDAVAGHPAYDLVSLLEDARRDVPPALADEMIDHYLGATGLDAEAFRRDYAILGAQRNVKIIGIFTRLYARDGKAAYLDLIPRVWGLLDRDLAHPALADLKLWFDRHVPAARRGVAPRADATSRLPKQALLLAAGLGLRMRPLTLETPKPLIAVAGQPMLDRMLDQLAEVGVDRAVVNMHHLPDCLRTFAVTRDGRLPTVVLSDESDLLLDSGGGVKKMLTYAGDAPVYVLNSDMLWRDRGAPALTRLGLAFEAERMDGLLMLCPRDQATGYDGPGDFYLGDDGRLTRRGTRANAPYVFTGIQILQPELFAKQPEGPFSLNLVYDAALAAGRLYGLVHDGDWMHVGTPDAIGAAEQRLLAE
ncbi:phosphotransferase [Govanella unica]|uniref:Phosphotransferase n=1 Tax=Govanella unica TaxID=2975056 RepID=A0A9X3U0E2_9PROT|nr:phosphotransferase [Govania unica]MDA5194574.1 phosphotransferase [Govania unica]